MLYKTLSAPLFVQIEVTTLCTQSCTHCYNFWRQKQCPHSTLTKSQADEIVRQLVEAKVFRVIVTGGEPLLFPDITLQLIRDLVTAGIRVHLNSNLVPMDEALSIVVAESGVHSVLTSLMSYDPDTHDRIAHRKGAWESTVEGIRMLMAHGNLPGVNMVVSKLNYGDVYETGRFVAELTGRAFTATKAISPATGVDFPHRLTREQVRGTLRALLRVQHETGMFVDALEHYAYCLIGDVAAFPRLTQRRCSAAITSCTIGADGTVRPCSHAPCTYGNVFSEGFIAAWDAMEEWRDGSLIPAGCKSCKYMIECSGGCRVEALVVNGSLSAMDPYATCGEDVISLPKPRSLPADFLKATVAVREPLVWRTEPYGVIVVGDGGSGEVTFLNKETGHFLQALAERGPTLVSTLKELYQLDHDSLRFLWELIKKGVLRKL